MPAATGRAGRAAHGSRSSRVADAPSRARPRSRSITLLIVGPMLCAIALTSLAYLGLSQQAQRDALARVGLAAQASRGAIRANMGDLTVKNGQLASALPANVSTLNNNNGEATQLRALAGVDTLIAQREQSGFVVVASSLAPSGAGAAPAALGATLGGSLAANACANTTSGATGSLSLAGVSYVAGAAPLMDGSGSCVGAVVALLSVSAMQATTLEYTVILAMAGALLALVTVVVGLLLHGREQPAQQPLADERARAALDTLDVAQAEYAAQAEQRAWLGRRLATGRGHMQRLMATLAVDRVALQEATSDVWAGVSHPGAPVDPAIAMRLARENAVVAARIGSRLNDVDAVAADLFADLDAAEDLDQRMDEALAEADAALANLRAVMAPSDERPASRPRSRRESDAQDLYATNRTEAQPPRTAQTPRVASSGAQSAAGASGVSRFSGSYPAVRADSSQHRAMRGESGRQQAMRSDSAQYRTLFNQGSQGASGQRPAVRRSDAPGASGASGAQRTEWQAASSSGRHRAQQRPQPRNPGNPFGTPQDGRDRGSSGSRWLND